MEYAVILGVTVAILIVKAYTMFSLGRFEREVGDLNSEDKAVTEKIDALDATRTQLEREYKDLAAELDKLDNTKNQLVVSIQKFGAEPVAEPTPVSEGAKTSSSAAEGAKDLQAQDTNSETEESAEAPGAEQEEQITEIDEVAASDQDESIRLLVVDDNTELTDLLVSALGKRVLTESATDGLEALHLMLKEGKQYDIVLTDLNMPNIDGWTLINKVPEGTTVIVMSAYLDRPEFEGVTDHPSVFRALTKPFRLGEVKDAIDQLIEKLGGPNARKESTMASDSGD